MGTRGFWQDAFTVTTNQPLSKEEEAWLDSIADKIVKRGLAQPAILFIESTKPVHFITGPAARFVDSIFSIVVPEMGTEGIYLQDCYVYEYQTHLRWRELDADEKAQRLKVLPQGVHL